MWDQLICRQSSDKTAEEFKIFPSIQGLMSVGKTDIHFFFWENNSEVIDELVVRAENKKGGSFVSISSGKKDGYVIKSIPLETGES